MHGYYIRTKLLEALGVKRVATTTVVAHQPPEQATNKTPFEYGIHQPHLSGARTTWASGDRRSTTAGNSHDLK